MFVADMWIFFCSCVPHETCDITNCTVCVCDPHVNLTFAADIDGVVSLSVGAIARTTEESSSNSRLGREIYPFYKSLIAPQGPTKPSVHSVLLALFKGLKRTKHELGHPHPSGVHIKNECSSQPTPTCSFVACTGIILCIVLPN